MPEPTEWSGVREHVLLLSRFLRSPRTVGAVSPSSRIVAREFAALLPAERPLRVIELGAGTGALTGATLEKLGPADRFLALDIEPEFVRQLRLRWPKIESVCGSAEQLHRIATDRGMAPVDHIISGLPFSTLPTETTRRILRNVADTLRPGGTFTTFQYVHAYWLMTGITFRREMTRLMGAPPERRVVWLNVPPAYLLTWRLQLRIDTDTGR